MEESGERGTEQVSEEIGEWGGRMREQEREGGWRAAQQSGLYENIRWPRVEYHITYS